MQGHARAVLCAHGCGAARDQRWVHAAITLQGAQSLVPGCSACSERPVPTHPAQHTRSSSPSQSRGSEGKQAGVVYITAKNSDGEESACSAGDAGLIPGSGRSPGGGRGNPLQHSCLENPTDRGAWRATVHGVSRVGHNLMTEQQQQRINTVRLLLGC